MRPARRPRPVPPPQGSPPSLGATSSWWIQTPVPVTGSVSVVYQTSSRPGWLRHRLPQVGLHRCHRLSGSLRPRSTGRSPAAGSPTCPRRPCRSWRPGHPLHRVPRVNPLPPRICMAWPVTLTAVSPAKSFDIEPRRSRLSCPAAPSRRRARPGGVRPRSRWPCRRAGRRCLVLDDRFAELLAGLRVVQRHFATPRVRSRSPARRPTDGCARRSPSRRCRGRRPSRARASRASSFSLPPSRQRPGTRTWSSTTSAVRGTDAVLVELLAPG